LIGAIIGDIAGSIYEHDNTPSKDCILFTKDSRYTDDTILMIATYQAIMSGEEYWKSYRKYGRMYPDAGYGGYFQLWLKAEHPYAYGSWGNGAAVRSIPIGFVFNDIETVLKEARSSAIWTHNHIEAIKGAQAISSAIFYARSGYTKDDIADIITTQFNYNLDYDYRELLKNYSFDISCQGSVPQAIFCFLNSNDFEDAIRTAISIGGDSDTIAAMTGGIAEAYYGMTMDINLEKYFDARLLKIINNYRLKSGSFSRTP